MTASSAVQPRCGEPTRSGRPCRMVVPVPGDACGHHFAGRAERAAVAAERRPIFRVGTRVRWPFDGDAIGVVIERREPHGIISFYDIIVRWDDAEANDSVFPIDYAASELEVLSRSYDEHPDYELPCAVAP